MFFQCTPKYSWMSCSSRDCGECAALVGKQDDRVALSFELGQSIFECGRAQSLAVDQAMIAELIALSFDHACNTAPW